jgi:hypothetical protein
MANQIKQPQRILTLWGLLTYEPETKPYFESETTGRIVAWGYKPLNGLISQIGKRAVIRSVSYSHLVFPVVENMYTVQIFATLVYTGPSPKELFGAKHSDILEEISEDATTLQVEL